MSDAWEIEEEDYGDELWYGGDGCGLICVNRWTNGGCKKNPEEWDDLKKQARLIAAAPDLLEALEDCVNAMWHFDSHAVNFDWTVMFSDGYDFSGLEGCSREEFLAEYECVVWRSGGKWSGYCTFEGSMWFEQFDTADAAKEQCMRLLDKVLPDHPAMRARAAIAKATGEQK